MSTSTITEITPYPWLPVEVIENIISELWSSHLSADERIMLMTSSALVNKIWADAFNCITFKDVYIPCPSYVDQLFRILRGESPIFDKDARIFLDAQCRSIHLTVDHAHVYPAPAQSLNEQPAMGKSLSELAYTLCSIPYFPNLRTISVEYRNTGFNDLFDNLRFISFPEQVTNLELNFTFSPLMPTWLVNALRSNRERQKCIQWSLPSIRYLSIHGGSEALVTDMVSLCAGIEVLELDFPADLEAVRSETHLIALHKTVASETENEVMPKLIINAGGPSDFPEIWEGTCTTLGIFQFRPSQ